MPHCPVCHTPIRHNDIMASAEARVLIVGAHVVRLNEQYSIIMETLANAMPHRVTHAELHKALYGSQVRGSNVIHVQLNGLRRKIKHLGIMITHVFPGGYGLEFEAHASSKLPEPPAIAEPGLKPHKSHNTTEDQANGCRF